jgi:Bacterial SH3 domain
MSEIARPESFLSEIEILLSEGKYDVAQTSLMRHLEEQPSDRESSLYLLLVNATLEGPETYEEEIDRLRDLLNLTTIERDVVRRLFIIGFKAAEEAGRQDQAWAYQRLLRRLLLDQELDRSIPRTVGASAQSTPLFSQPTVERPVDLPTPRVARLGAAFLCIRAFVDGTKQKVLASMRLLRRAPVVLRSIRIKPLPDWTTNKSLRGSLIAATIVLIVLPTLYFLMSERHFRKQLASNATASSGNTTISEADPPLSPLAVSANANEPDPISLKRVRSIVAGYVSSLRAAYSQARQKNPDLMGSLVIKITVDQGGTVIKAEDAGSRVSDSDFLETILGEVQKWRFPKTDAGTTEFTLPLLFVPEGMDRRTIVRWEKTVNAVGGEAKILHPLYVSSSPTVRDRRVIEANEENPAEFKIQKTGFSKVSKIRTFDEAPKRSIEYKTRRSTPLREKPRFASTTTENVDPGTIINILETKGDWVKIRTRPSGSVGYVRKEYVVAAANGTQ